MEGFWFTIAMLALGVIGWGIKKYIEHLELSRENEKKVSELITKDTSAMLAKINIAIVELRLAVSSMSKECDLKHMPIASDIKDLKKKSELHDTELNNHNSRIQKLEHEKGLTPTVGK